MISWLGHLERMEEDRMPKKIFTQELEETRRRGRPRKGWREEVERDLQVLGMRRWRELVTGTNEEVLFDRPKTTAGCSANGRRRSKTNQMYNILKLFYFGTTFYMFRTVSPSIIRSLRLYIQHQVYVIQVLWLLASMQPQNLYGTMLYVQS